MSDFTIDPALLVTPPVVQVPGNEPTPIPDPVVPESAPPNVLVSPQTPTATEVSPSPIASPFPVNPPAPVIDPAFVGPVESLTGPLPSLVSGQSDTTLSDSATPIVHPATQVQPLKVTPGITDPNITLSQIEPGIKWAIASGLLTVDDLANAVGNHVRELFSEFA